MLSIDPGSKSRILKPIANSLTSMKGTAFSKAKQSNSFKYFHLLLNSIDRQIRSVTR